MHRRRSPARAAPVARAATASGYRRCDPAAPLECSGQPVTGPRRSAGALAEPVQSDALGSRHRAALHGVERSGRIARRVIRADRSPRRAGDLPRIRRRSHRRTSRAPAPADAETALACPDDWQAVQLGLKRRARCRSRRRRVGRGRGKRWRHGRRAWAWKRPVIAAAARRSGARRERRGQVSPTR